MTVNQGLRVVLGCCALLLAGCATILNGSTQAVTIEVPNGTIIDDEFGNVVPMTATSTDTIHRQTLTLQRKLDYNLRLKYKNWLIKTGMQSRVQFGWFFLDYFTAYVGYVVDGITSDWCSFEGGLRAHFPDDRDPSATNQLPYLERYNPESGHPNHLNVFGSIGLVGPIAPVDFVFPFMIRGGFGYDVSRQVMIVTSASTGEVGLLPRTTRLSGYESFTTFDLGLRLRLPNNLYATTGVGLTNASSDSLYINVIRLNLQTNQPFTTTQNVGIANTSMTSLFLGLGVSGSAGFLEVRHCFGLSAIPLPLGETGHFESTSIEAGLLFSF